MFARIINAVAQSAARSRRPTWRPPRSSGSSSSCPLSRLKTTREEPIKIDFVHLWKPRSENGLARGPGVSAPLVTGGPPGPLARRPAAAERPARGGQQPEEKTLGADAAEYFLILSDTAILSS